MAKRVSFFNPETDFQKGGGMLAPGYYRVEEARFTIFDFNGKGNPATCLSMVLQPVKKTNRGWKEDGPALEHPQYWPASSPEYFEPTEDERGLVAVGKFDSLSADFEFGLFMEALIKAGLDGSAFDNDISVLDGMIAYFDVIPHPRQSKIASAVTPGEKPKERKLVVVTSIEELESEDKPAKRAKKQEEEEEPEDETEETEETEDEDEDEDADDEDAEFDVAEVLKSILKKRVCVSGNSSGIERNKVRNLVFAAAKNDYETAEVKQIAQAVNDDKVLKPALKALGWKLVGSTIKK